MFGPVSRALVRIALLVLLLVSGCISQASAQQCVVLLHGLGRSHRSMSALGRRFAAHGYLVVNEDYLSTRQTIAASASIVSDGIDKCRMLRAAPINFVTHSLGGVVLRQYFQDHDTTGIGRVVMLAPPNHGSEIIDHLGKLWWFKWALGPAAQELGTAPDSLPNRLRPIGLPIGIIAGTRSYEPWFAAYLDGPNDGKVRVASTRLNEMSGFITIKTSHTFITTSSEAGREAVAFVATGHFLLAGLVQ